MHLNEYFRLLLSLNKITFEKKLNLININLSFSIILVLGNFLNKIHTLFITIPDQKIQLRLTE
jgi:hypothetical protein